MTKVEKYDVVEPAHQDIPKPVAVPSPTVEPDTEEIEVDPIDELLSQVDDENNQGYIIRVDRLPDYRKTGIWGRHAPVEFAGEIEANLAYLPTIQTVFGSGDYRLTLQDENRQIAKRWKVHIGAPVQTVTAQAARNALATPAPIVIQQPAPATDAHPVDPIEEFIKQAERLAKLRTALGWNEEPKRVAQHEPPPPQEKPLEERITLLLLEKMIDKGDTGAVDTLLSKYLGPPKEEPSLMSGLVELAKPLMPMFIQLMMAQMNRPPQPAAQLPPTTPASIPSQISGPPAPPVAGTPAVVAPPVGRTFSIGPALPPSQSQDPAERAYQIVIQHIVDNCRMNAGIAASCESIYELADTYPQVAEFVGMLLQMPPANVVDMLVQQVPSAADIRALPHVADWIATVQADTLRIFSELPDGEPESPPAQSQTPTDESR